MAFHYHKRWIHVPLVVYQWYHHEWACINVESGREWHGYQLGDNYLLVHKYYMERLKYIYDYAVQNRLDSIRQLIVSRSHTQNWIRAGIHCESKYNGVNRQYQSILVMIWLHQQQQNRVTIVSSIGYVVLSGNMQVDKHETTLFTLFSCDTRSTLSLIEIFFLWKIKKLNIILISIDRFIEGKIRTKKSKLLFKW